MTRRISGTVLFAAGCAMGVATATFFGGDAGMRAVAQQPGGGAEASDARYRISSWGSDNNHGAYLINTQTGEVWSVVQGSAMQGHGRPVAKDAN